jgi:hypothetical protein
MFILSFNLIISVSFVTYGRRSAYVDRNVDTLAFGHVSELNGVNEKSDRKDKGSN